MNAETKTPRARPAAVTLTASAEKRIADLMAQAPEGAIGVKLSTPRRGCSGLAYSVDYVTEEAKFDEKIETPDGTFYIDSASVLYLVGSIMDWRYHLPGFLSGITFGYAGGGSLESACPGVCALSSCDRKFIVRLFCH